MCGYFIPNNAEALGMVFKKKSLFVSLSVHVLCVLGWGRDEMFETSIGEDFLKLCPKGLITAVFLKLSLRGLVSQKNLIVFLAMLFYPAPRFKQKQNSLAKALKCNFYAAISSL